jgi:hypothetical protein
LPETLEYPVSTSSYRLKLSYEYAKQILKKVKDANSTTGVPWKLAMLGVRANRRKGA